LLYDNIQHFHVAVGLLALLQHFDVGLRALVVASVSCNHVALDKAFLSISFGKLSNLGNIKCDVADICGNV